MLNSSSLAADNGSRLLPPAYPPDAREAHKHTVHQAPVTPPRRIPMVAATMGAAPAEEVEAIQLLASLPMPANLGPTIDTGA